MLITVLLIILDALLCFYYLHVSWSALITFLWIGILIRIALTDIDTMKIPDRWNLLLALVGLLSIPVMGEISLYERMAGFFVISLPMLVFDVVFPGGFGGGDIKLMAAAGLFLGWRYSLLAAFLAFFGAGIFGGCLLIVKKAGRKDTFAFGPFLCSGLSAAALAGDQIIRWLFPIG